MNDGQSKFLLCIETSENRDKKTSEEQFFEAILSKWEMGESFKICCVSGKSNLVSALPNIMKEHFKDAKEENYEKIIICFDADEKSKEENKTAIIEQICKYNENNNNNKIQKYKIFLLPDNECKNDGKKYEFENLLECIATNKDFFVCWKNFIKCLEKKEYKMPNQKKKMYSYIDTVNPKFANKREWDFKNEKYWNLKSNSLEPLKDFLKNLRENVLQFDNIDDRHS